MQIRNMSRQLFGTDGIRGPVGTYPLTDEGMLQIGKAVGSYFTGPGTVLVGWDPRESSEELVRLLVQGLAGVGTDVCKVGVVPTPGLAYLARARQAKAGVMITASHNPYTDNGVKVFTPDGRKLSDKDQAGINDLIDKDIPDSSDGTVTDDGSAIRVYEDLLINSADDVSFKGISIALDSANGATSGIAEHVFKALGADVTPMNDGPDGQNINVKCGATDPASLQDLVANKGLDAGAAFDGDGDRVIMVDARGRQLTGDHILYILAVTGGHRGVAATIMSNQGLETGLERRGIRLERTPVGDRSVLSALDSTGFTLGGEQSGHIIMPRLSPTGDGLLAAISVLAACEKTGKTLDQWYDELELLPQALVSIPFPDKHLLESKNVQDFLADESAKLAGKGRLNVRASGTEPKVRVMVEAPDADKRAQGIADDLIKLTHARA